MGKENRGFAKQKGFNYFNQRQFNGGKPPFNKWQSKNNRNLVSKNQIVPKKEAEERRFTV